MVRFALYAACCNMHIMVKLALFIVHLNMFYYGFDID